MREHSKSHSGKRKSNKGILRVIYFFAFLFMGMIGYMIYFIAFQAPDLMSNAYNARMDVFNNQYVRGEILSADGQVLARTDTAQDGTETRVYPFGDVFAHPVGYSTKGKTGLEAASNFYLMASNINPLQKIYNELMETKSQGDNVVTTLDSGLQQRAYSALGDHDGAVVCMEPSTGRILAMVSKPSYDPNSLLRNWAALTSENNTDAQLLNRAAQGLYPPGSTFKIVMALEYMREHPGGSFSFDCNGVYQDPADPDYVVHCFEGEKHGKEDLESAFANSCNAAFAEIGTETDKKQLTETAEELLFNTALPVSITASKSRFSLGTDADAWTMMQTAIGQGNTMMTPLHSVMLTAAIANGGVLAEPKLLDYVESADGRLVKTFGSSEEKILLSGTEADTLKQYMRKVITDGTASKLKTDAYAACGKTGSAEQTANGETVTTAWFTGFAPMDHPTIAVCVVVEKGETGGRTAVPIAKKVLDYWIAERGNK